MATDQLSITFFGPRGPDASCDPARLAEHGEATVNELAEPFPMSLQAVSKHLKVLERAGLITRGKTKQLRPSRLEGALLKEAVDYLEDYRQFFEASFDSLADHLHQIQKGSET